MKRRGFCRLLLAGGFGLSLGACAVFTKKLPLVPPPPPQNYFSTTDPGVAMRRVAMLPAFSEKYPGEYLRDLDAVFNAELTKKSIFEVVPVSRSVMEKLFGKRQLSSVESLPADLLARLREQYQVDGVLLLDITHYSPYRPVAIGVRTKLVDASSGAIRWAFDYIFDSGNPVVARSAKNYQLQFSDEQQPLSTDGGTALLSPSRFAKFVANQTFSSLKNHP